MTTEKADWKLRGRALCSGALTEFAAILWPVVVLILAATFIADNVPGMRWLGRTDATDQVVGDRVIHRSGFRLRTDYGTGCQYLLADSAVTPRLGADGKQVCR